MVQHKCEDPCSARSRSDWRDHYFQAGLLIMNLRRIRELGLSKRMTDSLLARKYWFLDQDILNKYFCGSHISLPAEWNFVNCTDDIRASLGRSQGQGAGRSEQKSKDDSLRRLRSETMGESVGLSG